jgi:hypothetical protein
VAEQDLGYITNGVFIAAAIIAGYSYEITDSPNVDFGMSERSHREIGLRRSNPEPVLKKYAALAFNLITSLGHRPIYQHGRTRTCFAWSEDGSVRTFAVTAYEKTPFLVRMHIDDHTVILTSKNARALGYESSVYTFREVTPSRPKAEITVLLDEVEAAMKWVLSCDGRADTLPNAPFERAAASRPSADDRWSNVWSKRADEAYRRAQSSRRAAE